ncbi:methylmalonyl-CoA epimerase [bacterium]|nr:methylmalonyl-CoA epimerase [bacterium]
MSIALSHIAIACPQIHLVAEKLKALALKVEHEHLVPTEKVKVAMLPIAVSPKVCIELLEPSASDSPISKFLEKKPQGGIHHLSFEVKNLESWKNQLEKAGVTVLPPGIRRAARGKALFIHPNSMGGVLVELEEIEDS